MTRSLRTTIATAAIIGTFVSVFLPTLTALAFDIPGALTTGQNVIQKGEGTAGVDLRTILDATGLNGSAYADCASPNILGSLANIIKNFQGLLKDAVTGFLKDFLGSLVRSFAYCAAADIATSPGGANPAPDCNVNIASDARAAFERLKDRETQQNFIGRCVAATMMENSIKTYTKLIQQNGPFGPGQAWVANWANLPGEEADRARKRFYTMLVNADICSYMRNQVLYELGVPKIYIDNPPPLTGIANADGAASFVQRAQCTLPKGMTPQNMAATTQAFGYWDAVSVIAQPQNNPAGFEDMARAELGSEINRLVSAAQLDALAGGGFRSIADCANWGPDGTCLAAGNSRQTSGSIEAYNQAIVQAQFDWITSTDGTQKKAVFDIKTSIANRLINLSNQPLPLKIEFGREDNPQNFSGSPSPTPFIGSGDPNDPACTGGDPRCTCVRQDETVQGLIRPYVSDAIDRAMQVNSELFSGNFLAEGVDPRVALQAICDRLNTATSTSCVVHPEQGDEIVLVGGTTTISVHVINSDGSIVTSGGNAVAACEPGVQD